jgi:hypothetical protein
MTASLELPDMLVEEAMSYTHAPTTSAVVITALEFLLREKPSISQELRFAIEKTPKAFSAQERLNALDSLLGVAKGSDLTLDQIKTERLARQ